MIFMFLDFSFLQPTIGTGVGEVRKWNTMRFFFFLRESEELETNNPVYYYANKGTLDLFMMFIYFDGIFAICELSHDITYRSI